METLRTMCNRIGAEIVQAETVQVGKDRYAAEVHIRPLHRSRSTECDGINGLVEEVRIAFVGESNAGKSTLIGVLAYGQLDNGRGDARLSLLRHRHEILSGRTSSVAVEPLVLLNQEGEYVPLRTDCFESTDHLTLTSQRQMLEAPKVLQFFDLPGMPRFHRSMISTLTAVSGPDMLCIVVAADEDIPDSLCEYMNLANFLKIPLTIVLTKIDQAETWKEMFDQLSRLGEPVFPVSTTSGEGTQELLHHLMHRSKQDTNPAWYDLFGNGYSVFGIEGWKHCQDVGLVLKGTQIRGTLSSAHNPWYIGPSLLDGSFVPVSIRSVHRLRLAVNQVSQGLMAAVAISEPPSDSTLSRGMFLLSAQPKEELIESFLWTSFGIVTGGITHAQGILHCGSSRYSVKLTHLDDGEIRIDSFDGTKMFIGFGSKLVFTTNNYILAGLYI